MTGLKYRNEADQISGKSHSLPRTGKLSNFLAAAAISFMAACGSHGKPVTQSLCPETEGIMQSNPRDQSKNRLVMEQGAKYLLDSDTVIELAGISTDGKAIFKITDKATKEVLDVFELPAGGSAEITIGGRKITLSVCSINDGSGSGERSAVVMTSEPLDPYMEQSDAGMPEAAPQSDAGLQDSGLQQDAGSDSTAPPPCYPETLACENVSPPQDSVDTVWDYDAAEQYTMTTTTTQPGDGTVKVTMSFDPALRQCSSTFGSGMWNQCGYDSWTCTNNNMDYYVAMHSVGIPFFGNTMVLTDIHADVPPYSNSVSFSFESAHQILDVSETLNVGGRVIRLDDVVGGSCNANAVAKVSYFDCKGQKADDTNPDLQVGPSTYKTLPDGTKFIIKNLKSAPGLIFGAIWSDISVFASEVTLVDGSSPRLVSPAINTASASEVLSDWSVKVSSDGTGRILSIELTAPAFSTFKLCK